MATAVAIALLLSLAELLVRFRSHKFSDLISPYFFVYFALHCVFALVAYWLVPVLPGADELSPLGRSLLAGFGYAVVLRTKIMTVRGSDEREYALGPEFLYTAFSNYVMFHLDRRIRSQRGKARDRILEKFGHDLPRYQTALNIQIASLSNDERQEAEALRDRVINNPQTEAIEKVYALVALQLELQPEEEALEAVLRGIDRAEASA